MQSQKMSLEHYYTFNIIFYTKKKRISMTNKLQIFSPPEGAENTMQNETENTI